MLKVININLRKRCEIYSKITKDVFIITFELISNLCSSVFMVYFEQVSVCLLSITYEGAGNMRNNWYISEVFTRIRKWFGKKWTVLMKPNEWTVPPPPREIRWLSDCNRASYLTEILLLALPAACIWESYIFFKKTFFGPQKVLQSL